MVLIKTILYCAVLICCAIANQPDPKLNHDYGLETACTATGGVFKQRADAYAFKGDTCSLKFPVVTRLGDEEHDFCELYAPWRVLDISHPVEGGRNLTICHVEATLMCEEGWWQMFGHCFKMPSIHGVASRDEAKAMCAKERDGGEIAFMHHRYIVGIWRRMYPLASQIWVSATESWDQYIQKTNTVDGDGLALAFFGKHFDFSVYSNSLVKLDKSIKLQVLCQYKPLITNAEIAYLGRRYSEIYYPSVPLENGVLIRSASSYTSSASNMEVCKKTLAPFEFEPEGPFIPEQVVLGAIGKVDLPFILTRSGAEARLHESLLKLNVCQPVTDRFSVKVPSLTVGDYELKGFHDAIECDNMKSVAVSHFNHEAKLHVMSDSRSLPVWCKLGRSRKFAYTVPPGYTLFERDDGTVFAHRLYTDPLTYRRAEKRCKSEGALLSGINSMKEAHALGALVKAAGSNGTFWLGGRRKEECYKVKGFIKEPGQPCSRDKVIEWQDGVATAFYDDWWRDHPANPKGIKAKNPSSGTGGNVQPCLTYVYGTPAWADQDTTRFLDDVECDEEPGKDKVVTKLGAFCTKKIELSVEVPIHF